MPPASWTIRVNGQAHQVVARAGRSLLAVLRDDLDLTGSKYGCGEGQCGACTVLVDGRPTRSCVTAAASVAGGGGRAVMTIEGLAGESLHPLQQAFIDEGAMQCGYCTPGMIMAAAGLLRRVPDPGEAEIRRALQGNVCRCGTYPRIVSAVRKAAAALKASAPGAGAGR
jgi:nicotinate dehydrogenase subunit A